MRILVVGAGATGGFFGARLAGSGRDVTFLVRPGRAAALRERGLRLTGVTEELLPAPQLVTAGHLDGRYDLVLLSVKSTALEEAVAALGPAVGPGTAIVPMLNGMAHLDLLERAFGPEPVLGGVAKVVTTLGPEGEIVRMAPLAHLALGERDGRDSARVEEIRTALAGAGVDSPPTPDIVAAMWHKWAFISTMGALTCLVRGSVGEAVAAPGGPELARAVVAEAAAVAAAAGHPLPAAEREATTAVATQPGSPLTPSLYRDVLAGAPTEVEHIFGDLTARARALGVATPLLDLATLQLRVHQAHATAA
ncbi:2-dehydropantoate 2-reductase [Streptomyces sp. NPDC101132]|uniref:2-dehydropantoate 2-reductase n=1 Tax=Streptomyces sp. NPDC101132 TaxID=3366110 RepID=UPI0037FEA782